MKMNLKVIIIFLIIINFCTNLIAETNHLKEGKELFKNENYKKARIEFEKEIVFNPKSKRTSYPKCDARRVRVEKRV